MAGQRQGIGRPVDCALSLPAGLRQWADPVADNDWLLRRLYAARSPAFHPCKAGPCRGGDPRRHHPARAAGRGRIHPFQRIRPHLRAGKAGPIRAPWTIWYRRRLTRLFPVYWVAHIIFLVSPFTVLQNHIDYRFLLSFLGDRVYPVEKMFFYLVPAWWFMGLLIEIYIFYPFLYKLMERMGWTKYLVLCIVLSTASRYILNDVLQANGYYEMGGFFVCRLWEFAAGMVLGKLMADRPDWTLQRLLSWKALLAGIIIYLLGLFFYQPNFLYFFSDGLTSLGLSVVMIHLAYLLDRLPVLGKALAKTGVYSYSIYLLHQPYVMYAGRIIRPAGMGAFLAVACSVTALIVLGSISIEYTVNRTVDRFSFPAAGKA